MKFLLTNDDGIEAKGLTVLAEILAVYGDVYVVAPAKNNSSISHAMTLGRPLMVKARNLPSVKRGRSLDGTPADCIKYALSFLKLKPDLIVSGVNDEANVGTDILYSGTVSGAIEGNLYGYPALAISTAATDCESVKRYLPSLLEELFKTKFNPQVTVNINFPTCLEPKGVKVTSVGVSSYEVTYKKEGGGYRIFGTLLDIDQSEETDVKALSNGYISVSALKVKLDDDLEKTRLEQRLKGISFEK